MKSFLEEYGFAILAAIVVILLIMMASPVGSAVKDSLKSVVTKFTNTGDDSVTTGNIGMYYAMSVSGTGKGDLIVFDDLPESKFLIIGEKDGLFHVLLLSNEQEHSAFSTTGAAQNFGSVNAISYSESDYDIALNNYFESLPSNIKDRIKPVNITQAAYNSLFLIGDSEHDDDIKKRSVYTSIWTYESDGHDTYDIVYAYDSYEVDVGERYVFAPSVKEIAEFIGKTASPEDVQKAFFQLNQPTGIFLRDGRFRNNGACTSVFVISSAMGNIGPTNVVNSISIHPSFWIDTKGLKYLLNEYVDDVENLRS